MIRPILEYASVIWNPFTVKQIKQVESVQRNVTKRISGCSSLTYDERLKALKLPRLNTRREYFDLLEMYKVIHGFSHVSTNIKMQFQKRLSRGHAFRIRPCKFKRNVRKTALFVRTVNQWNALPASMIETNKLSSFKSSLRTQMCV